MKGKRPRMDLQDSAVFEPHIAPRPLQCRKTHQPAEKKVEAESPSCADKKVAESSSLETHRRDNEDTAWRGLPPAPEVVPEDSARERLKRHRLEVAGRVWIPDIWGQEELLKDLIDCSEFDASLVPNGIVSARAALVEEGRRANSSGLRIENSC